MPKDKNTSTSSNSTSNKPNKSKSNFLQAVVSAGMSLYANKDKIADKVSSVYSNIYGEDKEFDINDVKTQFATLGRLIKAYSRGEYRNVSPATFFKIVSTATYAGLGTDLIPDDITGFGAVDDISMISWELGGVVKEVQKFEEWESQNAVGQELQLQTV